VEACAKQDLRSADTLKGPHDVQRERDEPLVIDVREFALGLRPDEFVGIELRCVAREAMRLHPGMAAEKTLHVPTPMNLPAVPQQDDRAAEMTEQLVKKRDGLGAVMLRPWRSKYRPRRRRRGATVSAEITDTLSRR
jgi:hypothetical protein